MVTVLLLCDVAAIFPRLSKIAPLAGTALSTSFPLKSPVVPTPRVYFLPLMLILVGVALDSFPIPPAIVRTKSSFSSAPVPSFLLNTSSLKVTSKGVLLLLSSLLLEAM